MTERCSTRRRVLRFSSLLRGLHYYRASQGLKIVGGKGGRTYNRVTEKSYFLELRAVLYHICDTTPLSGCFR